MATIPYTCIRCDYTTNEKRNMKRHLYDRKIKCQSRKNKIELSDEIKEEIMENRIYHIPKIVKEVKSKASTMIVDDSGYVYIFYTRASKNGDESVYKIGKTAEYIRRAGQYTKGGNMKMVLNVKNRHDAENKIKKYFKIEFIQRRDYGTEFFEGDLFEMALLMKDILSEEMNEIVLDYEI
jgi:hypothetical protein